MALPNVSRSFVVPGIGQTGSFASACASSWALPGMMLYFSGRGFVEVVGASQGTVTYRNVSIDPNSEILEGISFAPAPPTAPPVEDPGGGGGGDPYGGGTGETPHELASQMSDLRGLRNGVPSRIEPITNNMLVGRDGYWQRRQVGQMRYPVSPAVLLNVNQSAQTRNWTVGLPGKPSLPSEVPGFAAELNCVVTSTRPSASNNQTCGVLLNINGIPAGRAYSEERIKADTSSIVLSLAKNANSITVSAIHAPNHSGNMTIQVRLIAYHY